MEFKEYLVKRKKGAKEICCTVLLYIAALVLAFLCMNFIPSIGGLEALLAVGCLYGAYWISSKFNREFEYVITDDCVDIDVIYNASNRKKLISFSIKDVEILASVKDANYNSKLKGEYKRIVDATTARADADVYFAVLENDGRTLIKFEPPYAALEALKKIAPSKVVISR